MKDKRTTEITLSIFPNARGFGFALIENAGQIIDYGIANIKERKREDYLKRFQLILDHYLPTVVILEGYEVEHKKNKQTVKLMQDFQNFCKEKNIRCERYSRKKIQEIFRFFDAESKYEIALVIVRWFKELAICLPEPRKAWEPENYRMGIFDAFSLAMVYCYEN